MTYRTLQILQATLLLGIAAPLMAQGNPMPELVQPSFPAPQPPAASAQPVVEESVAPKPKPAKKKGPVDSLKPGQFVWEKHDVYEGPLKIVAVLDIQRMYVFQNDRLIGFTTISAGKKGKETPTGYFNILQKNIDHHSNLYSNAPMPYMQRLTWDGIALHGGHIPGYPASHGCIRMPKPFAEKLYGVTRLDQEVVVLQNYNTPLKRPEPKPVPLIVEPVPTIPQPVPPTIEVTPPASPAKPTIPPASPPKPIEG